jgi:YD repeat-containing protein
MSVGTGKTCFVLLLLAGVFAAQAALATANDCVEDDRANGRFICFAQQPLAWSVGACPNTADSLSQQSASCQALGGTFQNPNCPGGHEVREEEINEFSVSFMEHLSGGSCSIASDTGWNATFGGTNFCFGGAGQVFQEGYLVRDSRRIVVSCSSGSWPSGAEDLRWSKSRALGCPFGSTPRTVIRNGVGVTACTLFVDCPTCNDIGNPVRFVTGTKVETETDYRGAGGLVFTRHYHSFVFPDPITLTPDGHSQLQLGATWRSNFDKRVIPVGSTGSGINALTFPDGRIQYFDTLGLEIFNYEGARSSLVTLPGGGYVYQGPDVVETYRADGRLQSIARMSGETLTLTYSGGAFGGVFVHRDGTPTGEVLPPNLLLRVTDSYGNALSFDYSAPGKLVVMTDPSGGRTLYTYDFLHTDILSGLNDNLASVTYPDGHTRSYRYTETTNLPSNIGSGAYPHALTSIVDENGSLYGTFKYNSNGQTLSTEHALGALRYQFARGIGTTTVTDPLGAVRTFNYQVVDGISRMTANSLNGGAGFGVGIQNQTYDGTGNLLSKTDFNNHKTCYAYDTVRNLETVRVEGVPSTTNCTQVTGTGAALPSGSRKVSTAWHPRWRMPVHTAEARRITTYVYNGDASCAPAAAVIADGSANGQPIGVLCTKTVQSTTDPDGSQGFGATLEGQPRTWSYTYNAHGKVLTADGPRIDVADVTTTTYYADDDPDPGKRGNVATIANALGQATSITAYNAHGQPLTIVDANGLTTNLGYDSRQRLTSRSVGGELTTYDYDNAGQLIKVTLPDTSFLSYGYDAAHRLQSITDNLGNHIDYTLDAMGNRKKEEVFDPANTLAQTRSRVFNNLNRLFQELGAQSQTTTYGYDNQGNLTSVDGPLAGTADTTVNAYDALNRLKQVTDPNNGVTRYGYDGIDQLVSVTDPRNLATTYDIDGLANLNSQQSPDTGATVNTYDTAGNLRTQTDAKSQVTTYAYDALNRVTSITFHDGSKHTYAYDQGAKGIGRLSSITETNPSQQVTSLIAYGYDLHGRTTSETRTIAGFAYTLGYGYDSSGRLSGMTYPSGRTIAYGFDALGRIGQVSTTPAGGTAQIVASSIAYQPFGGVKSFTLGNGQSYTRGYDQDGRIASYSLGSQIFALGYDDASRISFITDTGNAQNANTYGYDLLDRLTSAVLPNTPFAYGYDAVGNRSTKTVGSSTDTYAYDTTSNRLASISAQAGAVRNFVFDPNGSTTDDAINSYVYDTRGRMVQSTGALGATTYQVNALGQRIRKTNSSEDRVYHYDTRGRLIAETDPGGALKREYLYLNDIPLAVIQ